MNSPAKTTLSARVRWMLRRDLDRMEAIERACFERPWTGDEFQTCLRQWNCIGSVVEVDREIAGFMIYELRKTRFRILNFAVHPDHRRNGICPRSSSSARRASGPRRSSVATTRNSKKTGFGWNSGSLDYPEITPPRRSPHATARCPPAMLRPPYPGPPRQTHSPLHQPRRLQAHRGRSPQTGRRAARRGRRHLPRLRLH